MDYFCKITYNNRNIIKHFAQGIYFYIKSVLITNQTKHIPLWTRIKSLYDFILLLN
jgi:hypothetical protein